MIRIFLLFCLIMMFSYPGLANDEDVELLSDKFFTLDDGRNLCDMGDSRTKALLTCVQGRGMAFGVQQKNAYCALKNSNEEIQWVLNDLETGEIISQSKNAQDRYFGASASKVFVAAAFLHKHNGQLTPDQLSLLVKMIVKSNNAAWLELQRQTGDDGTDNSGRRAVDQFTQDMGYRNTQGFQGSLITESGESVHGNELNTKELATFLYDTYHRKFKGAEILWKIMHATKTGNNKVNKYTPSHIFVGGKTGTYHGENVSPETIELNSIKARNHVTILRVNDKYYGLSILSNTGKDEDVAVLGGGLIREFLLKEKPLTCKKI